MASAHVPAVVSEQSTQNTKPTWPWLGKLKRSLSYPEEEDVSSEMSMQEREALDRVLKSGMAKEAGRMRTILAELTDDLESLKLDANRSEEEKKEIEKDTHHMIEEHMVEKLLVLRDIVHRVDFARAFLAMNGLEFILGCTSEREAVPRAVRSSALSVLAALCEENPPVQYELLNHDTIRTLAALYFAEFPAKCTEVDESDGLLQGRIIQAMTAAVCGHKTAERQFCNNDRGRQVIESGLGLHCHNETLPSPPVALRKRCLSFLRMLLTSQSSSSERVELFAPCIHYIAKTFLDPKTEPEPEMRKTSIALLVTLLRSNRGVEIVLQDKDTISSTGEHRLWLLCSQEDARDFGNPELELWKILAAELQKADSS